MFSASEQNLPRFRAVLSFLTIPPHPRLAQQTHILALKQYSIHITVSWHFGYGFNRTFRTLTTNSILIIYIGKFKTTSIDLSSKLLLQSCIFLDVYTYITVETSGQSYTSKFTVIRRERIYQTTNVFRYPIITQVYEWFDASSIGESDDVRFDYFCTKVSPSVLILHSW
jgi:hypothetical protein